MTTTATTYTVSAPNGQIFTRTSNRVYTHAIIARKNGEQFLVVGFAGNIELAHKAFAAAKNDRELEYKYGKKVRNAKHLWDEVLMLEVEV